MESLSNWLNMGGYAAFVWSAYALWALGFAWLVGGTFIGRNKALQQLAAQQRRAALKESPQRGTAA
jgi:heme exporter protein CcmD